MTRVAPIASSLAHVAPIALLLLAVSACGDPWRDVEPVDSEPVQTDYETFPSWRHRGFLIEAVAGYEIEALVLSARQYRLARFGRVVPMDLALGWGPMSQPDVLRRLKIQQAHRWYLYRWQDPPPIPKDEMEHHSANVHILPATDAIYRDLRRLGPGDRVRLVGRLVNVSDDRGEMRTSRSREDRAGGACEVMWVDEVSRP